MSERVYRAGIIGTARVGSWYDDLTGPRAPELLPYSHASCYATHPRTELVAGSDLDPERLQQFGEKWGVQALYADYQEMLEKEDLDIVSITTSWGHDHAAIAPVVAASGVKGIFCEKPIATSMAEADHIVKTVQDNDVVFACAYLRRWRPYYHALRDAIADGTIGDLLTITAFSVGTLMHGGTHYTDLMSFLAGEPDPAWAFGRIEAPPKGATGWSAEIDPPGSGYIEMQNGVRFFLDGVSKGPISFVIAGTEGQLVVHNDGTDATLWRPSDDGGRKWVSEPVPLPPQDRSPVLKIVEDIVDCMDNGGTPLNNEEHSARTMELCIALHASHNAGGVRVDFPLADRNLSVDTW